MPHLRCRPGLARSLRVIGQPDVFFFLAVCRSFLASECAWPRQVGLDVGFIPQPDLTYTQKKKGKKLQLWASLDWSRPGLTNNNSTEQTDASVENRQIPTKEKQKNYKLICFQV